MPEHAIIVKNANTTKKSEPKIKFFLSDVLTRQGGSAEDMANKWLLRNAGRVKVYDIVYLHPNIALRDMKLSYVGLIYYRQQETMFLCGKPGKLKFTLPNSHHSAQN